MRLGLASAEAITPLHKATISPEVGSKQRQLGRLSLGVGKYNSGGTTTSYNFWGGGGGEPYRWPVMPYRNSHPKRVERSPTPSVMEGLPRRIGSVRVALDAIILAS
ncbi:hypothetical protein GOP47_0000990 [Adiantum capillus-veneris]|uniref:Uncharacterized protein n=1 Tax=Adiantum capillus-veneris TaxID=13818 RepID=A0A9D4ZST2_ADICA|nr:hypothetical protein GOP47_0000990 [Adiantum capillus-veneris]